MTEPKRLVHVDLGDGRFKLEHPDLAKPRELTPAEKIVRSQHDLVLTDKAQTRATHCWAYDCPRTARLWVREVAFDFKSDKAEPVQHTQISSADYPGPVPGFCWFHAQDESTAELARAVYFDRPEIQAGATPTRWFVVMTDGSRAGGEVVQLLG